MIVRQGKHLLLSRSAGEQENVGEELFLFLGCKIRVYLTQIYMKIYIDSKKYRLINIGQFPILITNLSQLPRFIINISYTSIFL